MSAVLTQAHHLFSVGTNGVGFIDVTNQIEEWLSQADADTGLLTIFIRHTSASLTIQENADPDVLTDLTRALTRLAPEHAGYLHAMEGADDMPAHIKTMLTATSLQVPVLLGRMALGIWQGLFVLEHRQQPHRAVRSYCCFRVRCCAMFRGSVREPYPAGRQLAVDHSYVLRCQAERYRPSTTSGTEATASQTSTGPPGD